MCSNRQCRNIVTLLSVLFCNMCATVHLHNSLMRNQPNNATPSYSPVGYRLYTQTGCHPACKEKERKSIYIAPFMLRIVSKRSDMDHSFTRKLYHVCLSVVRVHQMAPPLTEVADIQLQLQFPFSLRQPHSVTTSSISDSPIPSPITSSSLDSPLCSSITPFLFHSLLKTYLFHKSYPRP